MDIGIIGVGKLGICLSLLYDHAGHSVHVCDKNKNLLNNIKTKQLKTSETNVEQLLQSSNLFVYETNIEVLQNTDYIFIVVATPSLESGEYDIQAIDEVIKEININDIKDKKLIIVSTVNPGDCDILQKKLKCKSNKILYSPEFIAQGTIIKDILNSTNLIIGGHDISDMKEVEKLYHSININKTPAVFLSPMAAEISKIAINCFLTTKISFANFIGELLHKCNIQNETKSVLSCLGSDPRIGNKYLNYDFGFGGPCFPRDNRAFSHFSEKMKVKNHIGEATDKLNKIHLEFLKEYFIKENINDLPYYFEYITYKNGTDILTESQRFELFQYLLFKNKKIYLIDNKNINLESLNVQNKKNIILINDEKEIEEKYFKVGF